jgi:hypothetical protein
MNLDIPNTQAEHLRGVANAVSGTLVERGGALHAATRFVDLFFEGDVRVSLNITAPSSTVGVKHADTFARRLSVYEYNNGKIIRLGNSDVAFQVTQYVGTEEI